VFLLPLVQTHTIMLSSRYILAAGIALLLKINAVPTDIDGRLDKAVPATTLGEVGDKICPCPGCPCHNRCKDHQCGDFSSNDCCNHWAEYIAEMKQERPTWRFNSHIGWGNTTEYPRIWDGCTTYMETPLLPPNTTYCLGTTYEDIFYNAYEDFDGAPSFEQYSQPFLEKGSCATVKCEEERTAAFYLYGNAWTTSPMQFLTGLCDDCDKHDCNGCASAYGDDSDNPDHFAGPCPDKLWCKAKGYDECSSQDGFCEEGGWCAHGNKPLHKISASPQAELVVITGRNGAPRGRAERIGVMVYLAQDSRSTWSNVLKKVILVLEAGDHATENLWMQRRERHLCTPPWQ